MYLKHEEYLKAQSASSVVSISNAYRPWRFRRGHMSR